MSYKPFLIQKMVPAGQTPDAVRDSLVSWGMAVKSVPFKFLPESKELTKNDWYDENGDDEYIPDERKFKSYEMDVEFIMKCDDTTSGQTTTTSDAIIRGNLRSFFNYIKNGEFKIYDTYTGIGRQNVRYVKFDASSFRRRADHARLIFKVTFKVNDPITDITLTR